MKTTTFTLALILAPAALCAQVAGAAQATSTTSAAVKSPGVSTNANANAQANAEFHAPKGFSAEGSAKLEAMYAEAREHHVPREPMSRRVNEGQAKGASETGHYRVVRKGEGQMETTQDAMISAGHKHPSDEEMERGSSAMERGVTRVQIEALAKRTPSDRSLVVAFDVLAKLAARGVPVTQALAQVEAKIDSRASDASIASLVTTGNAGVGVGGGATGAASGTAASSGSAAANASGNAAAGVKGAGVGVTGAVTGTVGGVVKKP